MSRDNYIHIVLQFLPGFNKKDIKIFQVESGLINQTFLVKYRMYEYILQKVNHHVFASPQCIHDNYELVRNALVKSFYSKELLFFLKNINHDEVIFHDDEYWRMSRRIGGQTFDICTSEDMAKNAAQALAEFHKGLIDVKGIHEPISRFTDFKFRLEQFNSALSNALQSRLKNGSDLISSIQSHLKTIEHYLTIESALPKRIIHGDPKVSNFLFEEKTSKVNAIIDIDTIMRGSILYDFGDMVRSFANPQKEGVTGNENTFSSSIYKALLKGYLCVNNGFLTKEEAENLPLSVLAVSLTQCLRFLTDYLNNDSYYLVDYEEQNLHRAKNQFSFYLQAENYLND